jgi:hypothetical protein
MKPRHRTLFAFCTPALAAAVLAAAMIAGASLADDNKPALNYFRMSKEQFAEYSRVYAPGNARRRECHLEYLDCWQ